MKLDRNIPGNGGRGKYAIINLRRLDDYTEQGAFGALAPKIAEAITTLADAGILDWGNVGTESEFFLIKLKDQYAQNALSAYSTTAELDGAAEYAAEIKEMALRAGPASPWCKKPD